jgi:hypothetical protein
VFESYNDKSNLADGVQRVISDNVVSIGDIAGDLEIVSGNMCDVYEQTLQGSGKELKKYPASESSLQNFNKVPAGFAEEISFSAVIGRDRFRE